MTRCSNTNPDHARCLYPDGHTWPCQWVRVPVRDAADEHGGAGVKRDGAVA